MSEIQNRIATEKQIRYQLNKLIDNMENFLVENDLDSGEPDLEADTEGAILSVPIDVTTSEAKVFTTIFNTAHPYPLAQINFVGVIQDEPQVI